MKAGHHGSGVLPQRTSSYPPNNFGVRAGSRLPDPPGPRLVKVPNQHCGLPPPPPPSSSILTPPMQPRCSSPEKKYYFFTST